MLERELENALLAARESEKIIKEIYATNFNVEIKEDDSPVTLADKRADAKIREVLSSAFPEDGFLTEESKDTKERLSKKRVWIVDPVDGTMEFVHRNGEFATNIALCIDHEVVLGVINIPMEGNLYYAIKGHGAFKIDREGNVTRIHVSSRREKLKALCSRSFINPKESELMNKLSYRLDGPATPLGAALKFCRIAEGKFDLFIREYGGTKEWDVAAGDIIVTEAGGAMVSGTTHKPFTYNREDVYNHNGYLVANSEEALKF